MIENLNITAFYLNIFRIVETLGVENIPNQIINLTDGAENSPFKAAIINAHLSPIIIQWIRDKHIKSLEEQLIAKELRRGSFFTTDRMFHSKKTKSKAMETKEGEIITFRCKLVEDYQTRNFMLEFSTAGLTTATAISRLKGNPSVFVFGYIEAINEDSIKARPLIIGDLVEDTGLPIRYRESLEISVQTIDAFANTDFSQEISMEDIKTLKSIPEKMIKKHFASILNVLDVQQDWGGEEEDLFVPRIQVEGKLRTAAIAFKGPSKFKKLEITDCGKNGDQIIRLFQSPADLLILQHCHFISTAVRKLMQAFARSDFSFKRQFCLIDGTDTYRILKTFGKLK